MKELQSIVNATVESMISEGVIQKTIEEGVQSAITKAVNEQFQSYGSVTKQINKALEEGLQININDLPFESYNQQMFVAIKTRMAGMFHGQAAEKFMSEMDKVLAPAPTEMSITDLVTAVAETWKSDECDADELDDYATVELEECSWSKDKSSWVLKMWKQKESGSSFSRSSNQTDLHLFISNGKVRISHRQSYNPTFFSEHECLIFKLYSAGTLITGVEDFDEDDCDLQLKPELY